MHKSLSQARNFLALVGKYLARQASLTIPTLRALEDCRFLASLNLNFLFSSFQAIDATSSALPTLKADDIQTLLSAILTNEMTCLNGLQSTTSAWSMTKSLSVPLADDTKLYNVSLVLFMWSWVPKRRRALEAVLKAVYMQSFMDSLINPVGWQIWDEDFALSTLYYAEYNNTGPGSNTTNRVTWPRVPHDQRHGCSKLHGAELLARGQLVASDERALYEWVDITIRLQNEGQDQSVSKGENRTRIKGLS
ncbi:hypothetical protein NL676_022392 [Syzygium grande]|nr:hypothetical protein NL676_022392 [Syzygium grande]